MGTINRAPTHMPCFPRTIMEAENRSLLGADELTDAQTASPSPGPPESPLPQPPKVSKNARKRHIIIFVVVSLINLGLLGLLWSQLLTPAPAGSSDPLIGQHAPNFRLAALTVSARPRAASTISLSDFQGKPIVLNVWSS